MNIVQGNKEKAHNFSIFELKEKGHEPSWAELKIPQLELWLEPARLGLITTIDLRMAAQVTQHEKLSELYVRNKNNILCKGCF